MTLLTVEDLTKRNSNLPFETVFRYSGATIPSLAMPVSETGPYALLFEAKGQPGEREIRVDLRRDSSAQTGETFTGESDS